MNLKVLLSAFIVLSLLITPTDGHLGLIIGIIIKVLLEIFKFDLQVFGPVAAKGMKVFADMMFSGGLNGGIGGTLNAGIGAGLNAGIGAGLNPSPLNGGIGGALNAGIGAGLNPGPLDGGIGGALNAGIGAGTNAAGSLAASSNNVGASMGVNDLLGGLGELGGSMAGSIDGSLSGLVDPFTAGLKGMFGNYANIIGGLTGDSKSWSESIQGHVKDGLTGYFSLFGGLSPSAQGGIVGLFKNSLNVLVSVFKMKLELEKTALSFLFSEAKAILEMFEKKYNNFGELSASIDGAAPHTCGSMHNALKAAGDDFRTRYSALEPTTRQQFDQMVGHLKTSHEKIGKMLEVATPQITTDLSVVFNVVKNTHMVVVVILI